MKILCCMNLKGGVGKTVTAINLADILVRQYHKSVVLADCDGQMNLTRFFFPDFDPAEEYTMASLLMGDGEPVWCDNLTPVCDGLNLIPGSSQLYDLDLAAIRNQGGILLRKVDDFCHCAASDGETDFFIFDCPPGYTFASMAALMAADEVIIPMTVDGFSFTGMMDMQNQMKSLRRVRGNIRIAGVLLTQWHNSEVVRQGEALVRTLEVPVFKTVIRRTDKVPESTFDRSSIVRYSPGSAAAQDYRRWVQEYLGEVL